MALARSNLFVVALDRNEQWYRYHHLFQELLRAVIASGRGAWVQAEELTDHALRVIRMSRLDEYPTSALAYAGAARVALHRGNSPVVRSSSRELSACGRASRTRCRTLRCRLAWSSRGPTWRWPTQRAPRRCCARSTRSRAAGPDLGTLPAQAAELRASLTTLRTHAPGASTLTEAELRLLPYLATHRSFREMGDRVYLSRHTVKSHAMAIYRKLNVASRNAAVDRARELALL